MYSYEQRKKAIETYLRTQSVSETLRVLGYPSSKELYTWIHEYQQNGKLHKKRVKPERIYYTEEEKTLRKKMKRKQTVKDYFFISLGILLYAIGFNAFILPERVVMGGMTGVSSLLYYAFNLPPGIMLWIMNVALLILAYKALSKQFVIRTIVGVTIMSFFIDALRPLFIANPIITAGEDKFMHVLIGGMMGGAGLGIVFSHNGSTGGTDKIGRASCRERV